MAKKRANGEGSIRRKPNGRWEGRYTQGIDPNTGRAIQKSVSARTQAECKEKLAKAIRDNRGIPVNHNEDYTVAEWCRLWFETYSKPVIRPNTAKTYRIALHRFYQIFPGSPTRSMRSTPPISSATPTTTKCCPRMRRFGRSGSPAAYGICSTPQPASQGTNT